ncbi:MAG: hypothetical protein ABR559_05695, partial [Gemmatimonadota bacterium]
LESGANAEALTLAQGALASARAQRSADPISDRYSIAAAYRLIGDVRRRNRDPLSTAGGDHPTPFDLAAFSELPADMP